MLVVTRMDGNSKQMKYARYWILLVLTASCCPGFAETGSASSVPAQEDTHIFKVDFSNYKPEWLRPPIDAAAESVSRNSAQESPPERVSTCRDGNVASAMLDTSVPRTYNLGPCGGRKDVMLNVDRRGVGKLQNFPPAPLQDVESFWGKSRAGIADCRTFDRTVIMGIDEPNVFHVDIEFDSSGHPIHYRVRGVGIRTTATKYSYDWQTFESEHSRRP